MNQSNCNPLEIRGKIYVCCPGGSVTGGPELLHQLVDALRRYGHDAYISYYPFNKRHEKPKEYGKYDSPESTIEDGCGNLIILPEVVTKISKYIHHAKVAIWWLSVDNYFGRKGDSYLRDLMCRFSTLIRSRISMSAMSRFIHFAQSDYARDFLNARKIHAFMLTDYLSIEHFVTRDSNNCRENVVLYNPKKGVRTTLKLITAYPEIKFIPIIGMSKFEVNNVMSKSKIYIDFGQHPGKDRLPREAAVAGCCVITGLNGSAGNDRDIPIQSEYKVNEKCRDFVLKFGALSKSIFSNFNEHTIKFEGYRKKIINEKMVFEQQVIKIFGKRGFWQ